MRRVLPLLFLLTATALAAGCGDDEEGEGSEVGTYATITTEGVKLPSLKPAVSESKCRKAVDQYAMALLSDEVLTPLVAMDLSEGLREACQTDPDATLDVLCGELPPSDGVVIWKAAWCK